MQKCLITFYAEKAILQISQRNLQENCRTIKRLRQKNSADAESLAKTRRVTGLELRRAGSTDVLTHRLPAQRLSPSETSPKAVETAERSINAK